MVWDAGNAEQRLLHRPARGCRSRSRRPRTHVAGQAGQPDSVLDFYRAMLQLRRDTPELRTGRTAFFDVSDPILAFTRGGSVLCIFNLSPESAPGPADRRGALALAQGASTTADGTLTLHPNGFAIMEATGRWRRRGEAADAPAASRSRRIRKGAKPQSTGGRHRR